MVIIEIQIKEGLIEGFRIEGHAPIEFGSPGENLLCAAVSMLGQTLHSYLAKEGVLSHERKENGFLELSLQAEKRTAYKQAMELVRFGLRSLETQYPNILKIKERQ
ncbi:hypothetical protein LPTSP4_06730 [Leptospira ryugenii]|uniref:Ribosomal processing cysteine protease Prp n=1 Tax=Leptospira ryugenii TaxID=1917863 RepID=A0A2P2DX11_9LEPT|nr:ribosomal-processing cysteine protease Prp [Leptospira ryugenii]GBF49163.1 hypothetical protein LPTSP4_06730 [Leptospira ryugenii]